MANSTTAALPTGKPFTGTVTRSTVAQHVNSYIARLNPAQASAFYALTGAAQARQAGCAVYNAQYQWRQHLRSSGARVKGVPGAGNWGAGKGKHASKANAKANAIAQAQAKQAADATAQQAAAAPTVQAAQRAAGTTPAQAGS